MKFFSKKVEPKVVEVYHMFWDMNRGKVSFIEIVRAIDEFEMEIVDITYYQEFVNDRGHGTCLTFSLLETKSQHRKLEKYCSENNLVTILW